MTTAVRQRGLSVSEWRILALLVISGFLNYIDRSNLSVGATNIQSELHITNYELGHLLGAFFWTYALFQLLSVSGWLVDRFDVRWIFGIGFFLWSGATAVTGVARIFAVFFVLRLMLGMGESIAYPSYSRILANHFPEHHRGFANAMIDAGTKIGPSLGTLIGGLLMARYGWRPFFLVLGAASMLWLIPWFLWMPRERGIAPRRGPAEPAAGAPTVRDILRQPAAWFTAGGLFCSNYFWYFLITWLPPYLEEARHFDKDKMAVFGSAAYFAIAVSCVASGYISDRLVERGASPTRVRKSFCGLGMGLASMIVLVAVLHNETAAMVLLMLACLSFGLYTSNLWAVTQTLAGPRAAGKWTSLQNGVGNMAGVAAPVFTGWLVDRTGHFEAAFIAAALIVLAGGAMWAFGIRKVEQVDWKH